MYGRLVAHLIVLACASVAPTAAARAQAPVPAVPPPHPGPRIGLALSGGGARGLAHIGVLRALERAGVHVDAIAGTSMGSLVGGLYATGYTAAQLDSIARAIDWRYMFTDAADAPRQEPFATIRANTTLLSLPMHQGRVGLPSGVVAGQHVSALLARLTWPVRSVRRFRQLPIPFSAVATDITTGEAVVLDTGSLAGALRASMSLPSVFAPTELGGRLLVDGGISRNLPAQDVRALGADVVICSDVSEPLLDVRELRTIVDVMNQVMSFHGFASTLEERRRCDLYIRPDLTGLGYLSFDRIDDWIVRGDSATRAVGERLRELVSLAGGAARARAGVADSARTAPAVIRGTIVRAPTRDAEAFVASMLDLAPPVAVDPTRLERETDAAYASGLFETVTYSIVDTDSGSVAVIDARGDNADRVDFGFRYDDRYNAALLFNATVRHLLGFASTGRVSLRLGEQTRVALDVARGRTLRSRWVLGMGASYLSTPLDYFADGHRVAEATLRVATVTGTAGAAVGSAAMAVQVKGEDVRGASSIATVDASAQRTFASAAALLWWDHMDQPSFPTRGSTLVARYERAVGGGAPFSRRVAAASVAIPITSAVTLQGRATAGESTRDDAIPANYRFYLGSLAPSAVLGDAQVPFAGLRVQERNDFAVAQLGGALQVEVVPNVFVVARADAGNVAPTAGDAVRTRIVGAGISVGTRTIAGPIEVRVHGRSMSSAIVEFSAGHLF